MANSKVDVGLLDVQPCLVLSLSSNMVDIDYCLACYYISGC